MNMKSIYECGSRAGFWRLHHMFTDRDMPVSWVCRRIDIARHWREYHRHRRPRMLESVSTAQKAFDRLDDLARFTGYADAAVRVLTNFIRHFTPPA